MKHPIFITLFVVLLCMIVVPAFSQGMIMFEASHVSVDSSQWINCVPPVKIVTTDAMVSVYAQTFQEYRPIFKVDEGSDGKVSYTSWMCVDANGIRVRITYLKSTDEHGVVYLSVRYNDHNWIYRCTVVE